MSELETEQHRAAWRVVASVLPGSEFVSHHVDLDGEDMCAVRFPEVVLGRPLGCPRCGDPKDEAGLNTPGTVDKVLCRDWHEVCQCGERYDRPKAKHCRRRKHVKEVQE